MAYLKAPRPGITYDGVGVAGTDPDPDRDGDTQKSHIIELKHKAALGFYFFLAVFSIKGADNPLTNCGLNYEGVGEGGRGEYIHRNTYKTASLMALPVTHAS